MRFENAGEPALLLFYGGTFDPIHNGHLAIACHARDELGVPVRLMRELQAHPDGARLARGLRAAGNTLRRPGQQARLHLLGVHLGFLAHLGCSAHG